VVIFSVFYFFLDVDFGGKFIAVLLLIIPYVFTIVALNIFLGSLVKTIQQFNALIPIVTISMAMLGGALWPLEVVESKIILMLSKFMPIKYGIDLLYSLVAYDLPFLELMYPFSILLLMGVLMMGLGIHFIEKRHV
ncbi:MAG TPA: ABC transporter permease, partial [Bacillota bacterium]|nr:ABC transporter permease [Bacillota bacterium]